MPYDDDKYGVITRQWFGLTKKMGGHASAGYVFGSRATKTAHVARWYPRGPIECVKFGMMTLATLSTPATKDEADQFPGLLYTKNGASLAASFDILTADASSAVYGSHRKPYAIASTRTFTGVLATNQRSQYITIKTGRPQSDGGTVGKGTTGGSVAFFIDWKPVIMGDATSWDY